jgi:transposase
MRGIDVQPSNLFSYIQLEQRVPKKHPLQAIRRMVDQALAGMDALFTDMYAVTGRPSIAPERLIRAQTLQILYTVRSERQLMEQIDFNLLFRWFVGLELDEAVWDARVFCHNRDRLLTHEVAELFFEQIKVQANAGKLLSKEHFSTDGTLLDAAASIKSFKRKYRDGPPDDHPPGGEPEVAKHARNADVDFHGEQFSNATHGSSTDGDALIYRKAKGKEARLSFMGHLLTENRNGLIVQARVSQATGTAERESSLALLDAERGSGRRTLGADKGYDTQGFVAECRKRNVTPHVAQKKSSAIDGRTTRHVGYGISMVKRKRIEECFGWMKNIGLMRKLRLRGKTLINQLFLFTAAAYNLVRMRRLLA